MGLDPQSASTSLIRLSHPQLSTLPPSLTRPRSTCSKLISTPTDIDHRSYHTASPSNCTTLSSGHRSWLGTANTSTLDHRSHSLSHHPHPILLRRTTSTPQFSLSPPLSKRKTRTDSTSPAQPHPSTLDHHRSQSIPNPKSLAPKEPIIHPTTSNSSLNQPLPPPPSLHSCFNNPHQHQPDLPLTTHHSQLDPHHRGHNAQHSLHTPGPSLRSQPPIVNPISQPRSHRRQKPSAPAPITAANIQESLSRIPGRPRTSSHTTMTKKSSPRIRLEDFPQARLLTILANLLEHIANANDHLHRSSKPATPSSELERWRLAAGCSRSFSPSTRDWMGVSSLHRPSKSPTVTHIHKAFPPPFARQSPPSHELPRAGDCCSIEEETNKRKKRNVAEGLTSEDESKRRLIFRAPGAGMEDQSSASKEILKNPMWILTFHTKLVPQISIEAYLFRILKYCPTSNHVFISMIVYLDRLSNQADLQTPQHGADENERCGGCATEAARGFVVDSWNVHRFMIACLTSSSKFFSDVFYTNSRYARVGGLPLEELNNLETRFLLLTDFKLMITSEEMLDYSKRLLNPLWTATDDLDDDDDGDEEEEEETRPEDQTGGGPTAGGNDCEDEDDENGEEMEEEGGVHSNTVDDCFSNTSSERSSCATLTPYSTTTPAAANHHHHHHNLEPQMTCTTDSTAAGENTP